MLLLVKINVGLWRFQSCVVQFVGICWIFFQTVKTKGPSSCSMATTLLFQWYTYQTGSPETCCARWSNTIMDIYDISYSAWWKSVMSLPIIAAGIGTYTPSKATEA